MLGGQLIAPSAVGSYVFQQVIIVEQLIQSFQQRIASGGLFRHMSQLLIEGSTCDQHQSLSSRASFSSSFSILPPIFLHTYDLEPSQKLVLHRKLGLGCLRDPGSREL